jgi:outer membrane murein-binding lipoprotein Lpp
MKESVIRKVFCALNWPPKTGAFQKLITFIVEGLATKANSSTVQELQSKVTTLEESVSTLISKVSTLESTVGTLQSNYTSLESRVTALESTQS